MRCRGYDIFEGFQASFLCKDKINAVIHQHRYYDSLSAKLQAPSTFRDTLATSDRPMVPQWLVPSTLSMWEVDIGMAPSLGRQAWSFCCNTVCSERVLSPVLVLLVHGLLVVDVAYHRRELWYEITLWYRSVRLLVVSTVALYISTSCTDPGYLDSEPGASPFSCNCCHCFFLCCALCDGKRGKLGKVGTHLSTDGTSPEQLGATSSNLEDEPLAPDPECGKTVIDEGIQKRRSMGPLEIEADQEGRGAREEPRHFRAI